MQHKREIRKFFLGISKYLCTTVKARTFFRDNSFLRERSSFLGPIVSRTKSDTSDSESQDEEKYFQERQR